LSVFPSLFMMAFLLSLMFPLFLLMFPFFIFNSIIRLLHPFSLVMSSNHWVFFFLCLSLFMISKYWVFLSIFHPSSFIMVSDHRMFFLEIPVIMLTSSDQWLVLFKGLFHSLFHLFSVFFSSFIHLFLDLLNFLINILIENIFHLDLFSIDHKLWHEGAEWRELLNLLFCDLDLNLWIFKILLNFSLNNGFNFLNKLLSS
jgi:hypothetical protein